MKTEPIQHIYTYFAFKVTMQDLLDAASLSDIKPIPLSSKRFLDKYYYSI